jgi:hypothetical protein
VSNYSGESFVVDPQATQEVRGGGEIVKTKLLQPGGRTVSINYLVRGGRVIDVYLNGTISDLANSLSRDHMQSVQQAAVCPCALLRLYCVICKTQLQLFRGWGLPLIPSTDRSTSVQNRHIRGSSTDRSPSRSGWQNRVLRNDCRQVSTFLW